MLYDGEMVTRIQLPAFDTRDDPTRKKAVRAFRDKGAVWLSGVFTRGFIGRLKSAFQRDYASLGEQELGRRFALVGDRRYMISVQIEPPFQSPKLYANNEVMPIVENVLGAGCVISSFSAVVARSGAEAQSVHFDVPPLFESEQLCASLPAYALTMVVPLIDLDDSTGCTAIWEASHRRIGARRQLQRLAGSGSDAGSNPAMLAAGDVLLMDARLIHRGTANSGPVDRPILYIVYSRPWFRDHQNFGEQPAINIAASQLLKVPKKHRALFEMARSGGG